MGKRNFRKYIDIGRIRLNVISWTAFITVIFCLVQTAVYASQIQKDLRINKQTSHQYVLSKKPRLSKQRKVSLRLVGVPLLSALTQLSTKAQVGISYRKDIIPNKKVTLDLNNISVFNALKKILKGTNLEAVLPFSKDVLVIRKRQLTSTQILQETISGTVTDAGTGETLPAVNIKVKGTTSGTSTDADGNYSLTVESLQDTLVFSFVGYKSSEVPIDGRTTINISLQQQTLQGQEMVVVGYGTQQKSDLTGAISVVEGDQIANRKTTQISQALQGTLPGVMVTRNNNAPGSTANIHIRGITTIGNSSPLIIVDGVPAGSINDINPKDVESISVLKDAAAASIYGARAAAGVILVTTKKAKRGELNLTYNQEFGIEKPTRMPNFVDIKSYMGIVNEMRWNDAGNGPNEYPTYPKNEIENYDQLYAENPNQYPNTDWVNLIMNDYAPRQTYSLSLAAGFEKIRSRTSLVYDNVDALYDGRTYKRMTLRSNNDITINDKISASLDVNFKRTISNQPETDPMHYMLITPPIYAAKWSNGRVAEGKAGNNIYGMTRYGGFNNDWYNKLGGKISLDYKPINDLEITGVLAPHIYFNKGKTFHKAVPWYRSDDPTQLGGYLQGHNTTSLSESRSDNYDYTAQLLVHYTTSIGNHNLSALAGYEDNFSHNESLNASRDQYTLTSFPYLNLGPLEYRDNGDNAWETAYRSWFGRLSYNYKNRYLLQGNIRFDGSSRFAQDYRWGAFPSFSAGWVISDENFMKNVPVLSFLKLRGSWGRLGNSRIGNYPYQSTINFGNTLFYKGNTVVSEQNAAQWQYAIKDITWETTETYDLGVDMNFLEDKLTFSGDYYKKTTYDMLLPLEIPDYIGFDNPDQNTGKMFTNGWEVKLGYRNRIGEFHYSASVNLSDFKSKMGDLGGIQFLGSQVKMKGSQFNEWYGYISDGLFQTQKEVDNSAVPNANTKPGDVKYVDISGPEGTPDGQITPEYDRTLLGGSLPRYMYGANFNLSYKGFDFSMVIQGVGKRRDRLTGIMIRPLVEDFGNIPAYFDGNYWSKYNSNAENLNTKYPRLSRTSDSNNYVMSDYWLINGAYLRLKNVTVGYTIPTELSETLGIQSVHAYVTGSDLLSIDNYPKGWDPEVASSGYPITSSFVFGLSVKF